jgi:hypothetical protein
MPLVGRSTMDVFLSHSHADKDFVRRLAWDLKRYGVRVWYDEWEIKVGDSLREKVELGIKESSWLLVVLSPTSVESKWVRVELNAAFARELERESVFILPLLYRDCSIPTFLQDKVYADFRTEYGWGLRALLERVLPDEQLSDRLPSSSHHSSTEAANLRRIWLSGMLHIFIDQHNGRYEHKQWVELLTQIESRGFTPYDEADVGKLLERLKEQWSINRNRFRSELSPAVEWIFPAHYISQVEPIVRGDDVFWAAADYHTYRVNFMDGSAIWETKLDGEIKSGLCITCRIREECSSAHRRGHCIL